MRFGPEHQAGDDVELRPLAPHADKLGMNMNTPPTPPSSSTTQKHNPLHGLTLETILNELVAFFGWPNLGERIDIRCFTQDPSISSSLKFLRKTPWARAKVESLYLFMKREQARQQRYASAEQRAASPKAAVVDEPGRMIADPSLPTFDSNTPARALAMGEAEADNGDDGDESEGAR